MLPPVAGALVDRYLRHADRAAPGAIEGFYVVGSVALGAFRPGRSDLDFVAVVGDGVTARDLGPVRRVQRRLAASDLAAFVARPPWRWPLTCNGVFVGWDDLRRSPLSVTPVASHSAWRFRAGGGFDANPVTWRLLAEGGVAVRGPAPARLGVHRDDAELRAWCRRNLDDYWRPWAASVLRPGWAAWPGLMQGVAWGVLGAPRLHRTIVAGDIVSKEEAGEYALATFDRRWRPLIEEALAYWRGELRAGPFRPARRRRRAAARFVLEVADSVPDKAVAEAPEAP
jgi:hypothetical protein